MASRVSAVRMSCLPWLTFSLLMFHPSLLMSFPCWFLDGSLRDRRPDYDLTDLDVHDFPHNFPDPEARVKRTPHEDGLFGYLAKSAFNNRLWSQEVRQDHICGQWHDAHWRCRPRYPRLFENQRKNIGQFGVSAVFEFSVSHVFSWVILSSERKQRKHAVGKQLLDREKEKKEKVLWSVLHGTEIGVILQRVTDNSILMIEISEYTWSEELNKLVLVKFQLRKKILHWVRHGDRKFGTKKFRTRNIWITTRAWISKKIFNVQIKLSVRGYICVANWRWRIVFTKIATQEVAKNLKNWEYAAIRKKILKKNNDDGILSFARWSGTHVQWVCSSTILTDDPTFIKLLLPRVCRKPRREVGMPRNTREDMRFLETFLIVNMLDEILMNHTMIQGIWRHYWAFWEQKELRKVRAKNHRNQHLYFVLR